MTADSPNPPTPAGVDNVVFHARLTPHRSLDARGHAILFAFIIGVSTLISIPFYLLGALPIVGFIGLDVALLWFAFRVSNQRARACEELVLTHIELMVRRVSWRGKSREWRFNPLWVRLKRDEHEEFGTQSIALEEGRRRIELGAFLGAEEKADFATALGAALATARQGPRFG